VQSYDTAFNIRYKPQKYSNLLTIRGDVTLNRVYLDWAFPQWVTQDHVAIINPFPQGTGVFTQFLNDTAKSYRFMTEEDIFGDTIVNCTDSSLIPNCPLNAIDYKNILNRQAVTSTDPDFYRDTIVHLPNIETPEIQVAFLDYDAEIIDGKRNTGLSELLGFRLSQQPLSYANHYTTIDYSTYTAEDGPNIENSIEALHVHSDLITNSISSFSTDGTATDVVAIVHLNAPPGNYIMHEPMKRDEYTIQPGLYTQFMVYITDQRDIPLVLYDMDSYITMNIRKYGRYV
jgi:hypothetical protein